MLKPETFITINQRGPGRTKKISFDFVTRWTFENGWETLTSKGVITFPKSIYVRDVDTKKLFSLFGKNKNIGGFGSEPLIKRGDQVIIESDYIYWDKNLNELKTERITIAEGFVSKVGAKLPIEIEFEDNMWLLKQIPLANQSFKSTDSLEDVMVKALEGTGFSVNMLTTTTIKFDTGMLSAENETVAQFLAKLKKDYFLNAYFRGNELRIGSLIYIEAEAQEKTFMFEETIISSDLDYRRKDDVILSAVASNHIEEKTGKMTKDGKAKTAKKRIEVLVTLKDDKLITKIIGKGEKPDPNVEGERRTFTFPFAKTTDELIKLAETELRRYYYDGFKGEFVTFGMPYVQFGDNAKIINPKQKEQNGLYKIKSVDYSGGVEGWRQKIKLDYKLLIDQEI